MDIPSEFSAELTLRNFHAVLQALFHLISSYGRA